MSTLFLLTVVLPNVLLALVLFGGHYLIRKYGHWESWVVYERAGQRIGEKRLARHLTRRGAERWAHSTTHTPQVLSATLGTALRPGFDGYLIWANPEARRAA